MHLRAFNHMSKTFSHSSRVFNKRSLKGHYLVIACLQHGIRRPTPIFKGIHGDALPKKVSEVSSVLSVLA